LFCFSISFENDPKRAPFFPILPFAERVYLQSLFYLFSQSTTCLVTLVAEKLTGEMSSNIFRQCYLSLVAPSPVSLLLVAPPPVSLLLVTCRPLTSQLVTCHLSHPHQSACYLSLVAPSPVSLLLVTCRSLTSQLVTCHLSLPHQSACYLSHQSRR
jgi:hypothetical protein